MIAQAVTAYLAREKAANATPQGADHKALLAQVAGEFGLPVSDLREAVKNETFMGPRLLEITQTLSLQWRSPSP